MSFAVMEWYIIHYKEILNSFYPLRSRYWYKGTLTNSEDTDEMPHKAPFHQGLHCLLRLKQSSGTDIHHFIEILTGNPLKYILIDNSILIVSQCMG